MTQLMMPGGTRVEQGGPEDMATWWTCAKCNFTGPAVGSDPEGSHVCMGIICGGVTLNPNAPCIPWWDMACCPVLEDYFKINPNLDRKIEVCPFCKKKRCPE